MFEISELKAKKLPELKEIAEALNVPKYKTMKKTGFGLPNPGLSGIQS